MIVNSNGTVFVPSRGFLFFYAYLKVQPGDIMEFSSPHGDFSFSIKTLWQLQKMIAVFVPSRGFLFFYKGKGRSQSADWFSSPHGDFSFSIVAMIVTSFPAFRFSSPHGDFSFSIRTCKNISKKYWTVFVPSRGFLFFYWNCCTWVDWKEDWFSSPHGDFSFSIETCYTSKFEKPFSSPHGDFSFSIATIRPVVLMMAGGFRPLTGISLFLWN